MRLLMDQLCNDRDILHAHICDKQTSRNLAANKSHKIKNTGEEIYGS